MTAIFGMTKGAQLDHHIRPAAPGEWIRDGHCVGSPDPDLWYAEATSKVGSADVALAKAICRGCPVRNACLDYALKTEPSQDWGLWGATTRLERVQMRRSQRKKKQVAA